MASATIGFAQSEREANPFRIAETQSIRDEAEARGIDLIVTNAESDLNKEISDIQSMVDQGVDALIISPLNSEGLDPAIAYAKENGVPIMTIDRLLTTMTACEDYIGWVGSDFVEQGRRAADAMVRETGGEGRLAVLLGAPGVNVTTDRNNGFMERLEELDTNIEVVAEQAANYERAMGQTVTEQLIANDPDITAIYAHNDEMALGAVAALQAAGYSPGDVKIITIDGTQGAVQGIIDGWISGVIESNPRFGPLAFQALEDFYDGAGCARGDDHLRQGVHRRQRRGRAGKRLLGDGVERRPRAAPRSHDQAVSEPQLIEPVLTAVGVSKHFAGVTALDDVAIDLRPGEVHALVGENGAGKSTLIKVLTGVHAPDEGEITYLGENISLSSPRAAWDLGISTTFQEITLVPLMSVARNLYLGNEPRTRWRLLAVNEMNRNATALLHRYGIDIDVRRPVISYGAGVQQMIAIVRAISTDARVVILDEPTSSLEPREVAQVFGMIRRLRAAGVALLFVSHNLDEVFEISDRITILRDGRRARTSSIADTTKLEVIATMLGRDIAEVRSEGRTSFTRDQEVHDDVVLEAVGLSRRHQLQDVSLSVRAGEVLGLAGLLGSGRSETVRAVFGTQRIDAGSVTVRGRRVRTGSPRSSLAAGAALLPEDRKAEGIVPTMSVRDNIVLMALPQVSRWGFIVPGRVDRVVTEFIARLGIKTSGARQSIAQLSGGNQQKALIARLLCVDPRVLLLDEPTRGIDIGAKAEVQSLIQQLADQGRAIVLISSELEDVVEGSTRVVVLNRGTVTGELDRDEIDEHKIMELMGVPPLTEEQKA